MQVGAVFAGIGVGAAVGVATGALIGGAKKAITKVTSNIKNVQNVKYGQKFEKVGTYVKNPKIKVDWSKCTKHGAQRMAERGVSKETVNEIVKNGYALSQEGGKYLFLTENGAAVLDSSGKLITTYGSELFDETIKAILKILIGG